MGRPRKRTNQFLEPNLYQNGRYWRYRHPITKKFTSLGTDQARAVRIARSSNARILGEEAVIESITRSIEENLPRVATAGLTMSRVIDEYIVEEVPEKRWSTQTEKNELALLRRFKKAFGDKLLTQIDVLFCAQWLKPLSRAAHPKHRARLVDLFKFAKSKGYTRKNPAADTLVRSYSSEDKVRKRLKLEDFQAIYKLAQEQEPWMAVAMDLALVTLQRGGDLVEMRYSDIRKDKKGVERLYVIQNKTQRESDKAFLAIRLSDQIRALVERSRLDASDCPFLIHTCPKKRDRRHMNAKEHWMQVTRDHLTKTFSDLRDQTRRFEKLKPLERPTFHEIRSLGIHLYKSVMGMGDEYTQDLAGHADLKMTEAYALGHEVEFNEVNADMDLSQFSTPQIQLELND